MKHSMKHYRILFLMTAFSFISMYILMYAMVDSIENVYSSFNQVYMAGLMTAPMVLLELVLMREMYTEKKLNLLIGGAGLVALVSFFILIRGQEGIGDKQFLRSMISHHAGAILMCEKSSITDPEIKILCQSILSGQQREIEQMTNKLKQLNSGS